MKRNTDPHWPTDTYQSSGIAMALSTFQKFFGLKCDSKGVNENVSPKKVQN